MSEAAIDIGDVGDRPSIYGGVSSAIVGFAELTVIQLIPYFDIALQDRFMVRV